MSLQETDQLIEETLYKQVAQLRIAGASVAKISEDLKVSKFRVNKMMNSSEFKDYLKEQSDLLLANAANTLKAAMDELVPETLRVIKKKLKEDDLEAAKMVLKTVGIDKQNPDQNNNTAIQVILPDYQEPKEVKIE